MKPINYVVPMVVSLLLIILLNSNYLQFPAISDAVVLTALDSVGSRPREPFSDILDAFSRWDDAVGCDRFKAKHNNNNNNNINNSNSSKSVQTDNEGDCEGRRGEAQHVNVHVQATWIPDHMDDVYACGCGLTCLWSKSGVLADKPHARLYEGFEPPVTREEGDPLRAYLNLEAARFRGENVDIYITYHAEADVQATYAGNVIHKDRNYYLAPYKHTDTLVYWSSSRCISHRDELAKTFISLVPTHSFGKCQNNVGGTDAGLTFYPECAMKDKPVQEWYEHLHCVMSHYKFVLSIENTKTDSYVTEKLFYALEAGSVPIYFGAPNVWDFVPPNSIIDGSKYSSMEELANYVQTLAEDPIAYAEYHAWRRCGVTGNYGKARAASLDTVPCRLCKFISRKGGNNTRAP